MTESYDNPSTRPPGTVPTTGDDTTMPPSYPAGSGAYDTGTLGTTTYQGAHVADDDSGQDSGAKGLPRRRPARPRRRPARSRTRSPVRRRTSSRPPPRRAAGSPAPPRRRPRTWPTRPAARPRTSSTRPAAS
ncbi:hypothetical protein [Cellulomonas sp. ATA003]|uniref:hypothetical protein n=1 Tax=Cellulomonas sp. ATA003 TaxID=3073064 RepID=UPI002873D343|nr:hypothetical protein [Cellulomonas sp. ATA003]WNB85053.1 hypothetical protein REH70_15470 [Cellulomonas sp. ATA003]